VGSASASTDALRQVAQRENIVVALGGGAVLRDENWELIQQSGISIYLKVRPELLVQRIEGEPERPLLVGLTPQQRLQRISEIVESRKERYEQADIILENERTPAEAVAAICEALSVNGESTGGVNIVHVPLGERSYYIWIKPGLLQHVGELYTHYHVGARAAIITDETVAALYGHQLEEGLRRAGVKTARGSASLPARLLRASAQRRCSTRACLKPSAIATRRSSRWAGA
jgi:hypothetical protein